MANQSAKAPSRRSIRRWIQLGALLAAVVFGSITTAPELLAWPYHAEIGHSRVYSEQPIPPQIGAVLARADRLLAQSPVDDPSLDRRLFLSDGGWRWTLLALTSRNAFALRRPLRDAIAFNRSDVAADRIFRAPGRAGTRSLSGTIAHEMTHVLVAHHLGELKAMMLPGWKSEGYADYVAQESSLSDTDYERLRAAGSKEPAIFYYDARRRVAAQLRANGGNVDELMAVPAD